MKILFIGDVVGSGGRKAVRTLVPRLRMEYQCDFCIVNGENMAAGNGYSVRCLEDLADAQVDVFTSGDHTWDQKDWANDILRYPNVLRPANFSSVQPGRGWGLFPAANGETVAVLNLLGRTFLGAASNCPFEAAEHFLQETEGKTPYRFVDFHAEATSEKIAMGRFLDGKVTAVIGTHTHVATADEQIFPGGTAFQCDAGMVGGVASILGREIAPVVQKFRTGMPARFPVVEEGICLHGTVVSSDAAGRAVEIRRICRKFDPDEASPM